MGFNSGFKGLNTRWDKFYYYLLQNPLTCFLHQSLFPFICVQLITSSLSVLSFTSLFFTLKNSSSSSSYICHGVRPLVDPFRSHVFRSLFEGLLWFLLPVGEQRFITLGSLLGDSLFTCCIQFLMYSSYLSTVGVIFNSFAICVFALQSVRVYPAVILMYFISAAVILLVSVALIVKVSLPYNKFNK